MEPRVLIVEDFPEQLDSLVLVLNQIPESVKKPYRIEKFRIDTASWATRAEELLVAAATAKKPYDMVLLDLRLPRHENDRVDEIKYGLDLIKLAREKEAAHEILVISA